MALIAPQALGAFLTALYNFAITGSARPDALFLAWGPAGVTTARLGQGLLGLALDARYGIVPVRAALSPRRGRPFSRRASARPSS